MLLHGLYLHLHLLKLLLVLKYLEVIGGSLVLLRRELCLVGLGVLFDWGKQIPLLMLFVLGKGGILSRLLWLGHRHGLLESKRTHRTRRL